MVEKEVGKLIPGELEIDWEKLFLKKRERVVYLVTHGG